MKYKSLITGYIGSVCPVVEGEILTEFDRDSSVIGLKGDDIKFCTIKNIRTALKNKQIIKL